MRDDLLMLSISTEIAAEKSLRLGLWEELCEFDIANIPPGLLHEKGIYGGAQGVWVDKARTAELSEDGNGVTVAILHTGRHYPDDLSPDGVIYHYPDTNRGPKDTNEIAATKNASRSGLPIFVILPGEKSQAMRHLHLGWVEDWDDKGGCFLSRVAPPAKQDEPFYLTSDADHGMTRAKTRKHQERFRFHVLQQYGNKCAVCDIALSQLLIAAHIRGKRENGSDDWRNGLPLCGTHHDAFDLHLFGIDPSTREIKFSPKVNAEDLGIMLPMVSTIHGQPHRDALEWRWQQTRKIWSTG